MSKELTRSGQGHDLAAVMEWARAASSASIVPDAYRGKPADMMIAAGLGASMGLSPAESLYRIAVIKGKPTASAELIASKVREAGHRLRITGDDTSATCTIIRADDPDYEFTETRDMAWAQRMGLASQAQYQKQPGTMLKNRAITACARLACPEALYGVSYSPDEITESPGFHDAPTVTASEVLAPVVESTSPAADVADDDQPAARRTLDAIKANADRAGWSRETVMGQARRIAGRDIESPGDLTSSEAHALLEHVASMPDVDTGAEAAKAAVRAAREESK